MNRIFISAAHKSSGKTTLSIGICAALHARGLLVQPFKKGPDYIDPLWLSAASHRDCHNLDFNTMSQDEILYTLAKYGQSADISLIEANKGLFDGMALDGADSNAALAHLLQAPVILVINTTGTTRGVAPLLLGYQAFDSDLNIEGVIFNVVGGERHESKLRQITETYTDIPVLGAVHKNSELHIDERHLGLMPSNESQDAYRQISNIAALVEQQVDVDRLIEIGNAADDVPAFEFEPLPVVQGRKVKIGICRDPAFAFYYPSDLEALQQAGAELVFINTLNDTALPNDINGLFIGGGFPETQMDALAANQSMRGSIRQAVESGMPCYAECGGLMYLAEQLQWKEKSAPMVGVIPGNAVMDVKPQGRGYVKVKPTSAMLWGVVEKPLASNIINAHEFHYSRLEAFRGGSDFAYEVLRGYGIDGSRDGWVYKNLLASYVHMRDTSQYHWARAFVAFVRDIDYSSNIIPATT